MPPKTCSKTTPNYARSWKQKSCRPLKISKTRFPPLPLRAPMAQKNIKAERTSARSAFSFSFAHIVAEPLSPPNANMLLSQIGRCLYLKLAAKTCAGFVSCRASCLSPSRYGEQRQDNKTSKMPTTKRKVDWKQRKQPKIIGKRYNHQLGFKRVAGRRTALPIRHTTPFIIKTAGQHGH